MAAPAREVTPLALAEASRRAQLQIRSALVRDATVAWSALDFEQLSRTWPGWLRLMTALIGRYHGQAAQQAALFYAAARQHQLGADVKPVQVSLAETPSQQWIERALGYAAAGTHERKIAQGTATSAAQRFALTQTLGTASRLTLDGARTTIVDTARADHRAVGFYRVTDGDPCAFCALMASRGVVYHSAQSAGVDSKWHDACGCAIAPAFDHAQELPEISRRAAQVYADRGEGPSLPAFRAAWEAQRSTAA